MKCSLHTRAFAYENISQMHGEQVTIETSDRYYLSIRYLRTQVEKHDKDLPDEAERASIIINVCLGQAPKDGEKFVILYNHACETTNNYKCICACPSLHGISSLHGQEWNRR